MNRIVAILLNRIMTWLVSADLWEWAQYWVKAYEAKDLTSTEKRERVLAMLQTELLTMGRDLSQSMLNFAIEAAVQYVRRRTG